MESRHEGFTRNILDLDVFRKDTLRGVLAFDLETFSPEGFPYDFERYVKVY